MRANSRPGAPTDAWHNRQHGCSLSCNGRGLGRVMMGTEGRFVRRGQRGELEMRKGQSSEKRPDVPSVRTTDREPSGARKMPDSKVDRERARQWAATRQCPVCGRGPYRSWHRFTAHCEVVHGIAGERLRELCGASAWPMSVGRCYGFGPSSDSKEEGGGRRRDRTAEL